VCRLGFLKEDEMGLLVHLLDPEVFARLSDRDLNMLGAVLDKEIASNAEIRKTLTSGLHKYVTLLHKNPNP
jgi:hypothetical protein